MEFCLQSLIDYQNKLYKMENLVTQMVQLRLMWSIINAISFSVFVIIFKSPDKHKYKLTCDDLIANLYKND